MSSIAFRVMEVPNAFRGRTVLRDWLGQVARDHGYEINELTFVLMDDEELLAYNKRYLGHDAYTDVITFDGQTGEGLSGDVLMSYDRIRENAVKFGVSAQKELHRVMVHGLLHLLGYRDKSKKERESIRAQEDRYLNVLERIR